MNPSRLKKTALCFRTDGCYASLWIDIFDFSTILSDAISFHNPLPYHNNLYRLRFFSPFLVVFLPIVAIRIPGPNR